MNTFTKVRKWAKEVNATVEDSPYRDSRITVTLPNGKRFQLEQKESTSRKVINRGRGLKWDGNPKGLYMKNDTDGYMFQYPSQVNCIERMAQHL